MSFLHLQCLKDAPDRAIETASLLSVWDIPAEGLRTVLPFEEPIPADALEGVDGVVIGGSGWSVFEDIPGYDAFRDILLETRRRGLPMFGICFGAQALAHAFGGGVVRDEARGEYGTVEVACDVRAGQDALFEALPDRFHAQAWHHDRIEALPDGAVPLAWSQDGQMLQAFAFPGERIWGVQFHPERDHETFFDLLEHRSDPPNRSVREIRASLRPSPHATALLARFARLASRP